MSLVRETGVVLFSRALGEGDRIVHILTESMGKQSFIFKGIDKSKKRAAWILGGNVLEFIYYFQENKELYHIREANISFSPHAYPLNRPQMMLLLLILNFLEKSMKFGDTVDSIYGLTCGFLRELIQVPSDKVAQLELFTVWRLFRYIGLLSWPMYCSLCGEDAKSPFRFAFNGLFVFDSDSRSMYNRQPMYDKNEWNHFVCEKCACDFPISLMTMSGNEWNFLMHSMRAKWKNLEKQNLTISEKEYLNSKKIQELLIINH